jgi:glycosyltransferase
MKIFFFSGAMRAGEYGIGTYIQAMSEGLAAISGNEVFVVNINAKLIKEITVRKINAVNIIGIPVPENEIKIIGVGDPLLVIQAKRIIDILTEYACNESDLIFHFNSIHHVNLMNAARRRFKKSGIVASYHFVGYKFYLEENDEFFLQQWRDYKKTGGVLRPEITFSEGERRYCMVADRVISGTHYGAEFIHEAYEIQKQKLKVIHNGVRPDLVKILSQEERLTERSKLNISSNTKVIFFAGRLDKGKGVEALIKAYKRVVTDCPDTRLVIAGNGNFSKYIQLCEGIWTNVTFVGRLEKEGLFRWYQIADIGVVPSHFEQCSFVMMEMIHHGIPLIVSDVEGLKEIITHNVDGLKIRMKETNSIIEPDEDDLFQHIMRYLNDEKFCQRISSELLSRRNQYTIHTMAKRGMEIYRLLLDEHSLTEALTKTI